MKLIHLIYHGVDFKNIAILSFVSEKSIVKALEDELDNADDIANFKYNYI